MCKQLIVVNILIIVLQPIPENLFIVAACNPHRGNSMASLGVKGADKEVKWVKGTYYVRKLHPTLRFLMWDYGSLDEHQEREYVNAKMKMLDKYLPNPEVYDHCVCVACLSNYSMAQYETCNPRAYELWLL